jgi:hypothetical protein
MHNKIPSQLSDAELVAAVATLAVAETRTTVALIAHLAELEARQLHLEAGYPSMFAYCVRVLRLSEGGAYNRIEAARTAREFPVVLDLLEQGRLNLASLRLLAPHLTTANHEGLLAAGEGKSKREVQALLATAFPRPDVAPSIRKVAERTGPQDPAVSAPSEEAAIGPPIACASVEPAAAVGAAGESPIERSSCEWPSGERASGEPPLGEPVSCQPPAGEPRNVSHSMVPLRTVPRAAAMSLPRQPVVTPLSAERYQFRFTGTGALVEKLKRAQDLLRHAVPDGDPAEIFERALTALLVDIDRRKFAATDRPRASREPAAGSRTVPAAVKRTVAVRDDNRCAFVSRSGTRCGTRAFLEFHHVVPWARGGAATVDNIQLRCRAHNAYEADLDFGKGKATTAGTGTAGTGTAHGDGKRDRRQRTSAQSVARMSGVLSTRPGTS